jgi:hypothetical protein
MFREMLTKKTNKNNAAQRIANPCTPVRFRYSPPNVFKHLRRKCGRVGKVSTRIATHSRSVPVPFLAWIEPATRFDVNEALSTQTTEICENKRFVNRTFTQLRQRSRFTKVH